MMGVGAAFFLAFFGTLAFAELFSGSDNDDQEENLDDELVVGDEETVNSGDGDDLITIAEGTDGPTFNVDINAGDGDDTITGRLADGVTVVGGNGDDVISIRNSAGVEVEGGNGNDNILMNIDSSFGSAHGGGGDDTIVATGSNDVFASGDDGDDHLTGDWLDGGDGEDTLVGSMGNNDFREGDHDSTSYTGGDGADEFEIAANVTAQDYTLSDEDLETLERRGFVNVGYATFTSPDECFIGETTIRDFESGEDLLTIVPDSDHADYTYASYEIENLENSSRVLITFETEGSYDRIMVVTLQGNPNFSDDDLVIQQPSAAAA